MSGIMPTNIWLEKKGRSGEDQSNLHIRNYGRKFALQTSSLLSAQAVIVLPGLPVRWDAFPSDKNARCVSVRPEQHESNPHIWFCTAEYTTDYILQDFADPALKLPEIEWELEERQLVCPGLLKKVAETKHINIAGQRPRDVTTIIQFAAAPANSADQPFDPPPLYDKCDPVLCIEQVYVDFEINRAMIFNNSLNSDKFLGADPGQIRCKIKAKRFQWRDEFRWTVNYRFAYRAEGWQLQVLDIGTQYRSPDDANTTLYKFKDETGDPCFGLLDGKGHALDQENPPGQSLPSPKNKPPVFLTMSAYPVTPFAKLGIEKLIDRKPTLDQQ